MKKDLLFGTKGIWHKPASEEEKARDIPAVILEVLENGTVYIFTFDKKAKCLTDRTATIFDCDFSITKINK
jgi:hypothetical protein